MAIKRFGAQRFSGLESDVASLPLDADLVGAIFNSTDTLKFWIFDGTQWNESAGGGGITGLNPNSTILEYSTDIAAYTTPTDATATSENGANVATNAIDGNTTTFWESNAGINESITIDMGGEKNCYGLAFYIDKLQTGITETQFQIKSLSPVNLSPLKAYYQFNESSGTLANASTGSETLGGAANATVTGAPTYSVTGKIDTAVEVTAASGQYFECGASASQWNFLHNDTAAWSIAWWMKVDSAFAATLTYIFGDKGGNSTEIGQAIAVENRGGVATNAFRCLISNGSATSTLLTSDNYIPVDSQFHFYVLTYVASTSTWEIRRDNANFETGTEAITESNSDASGARRIWNTPQDSGAAPSILDELSVWNTVLSVDDQTTLYNEGNGLDLLTLASAARTLRTVSVADLADQSYNFIRFNGAHTRFIQVEGSSGSSLVMAANELAVQVELDPPLTTLHGQFTINGTDIGLPLNGGDPTSSVIEDPIINTLTMNNVATPNDPATGKAVLWVATVDANNDGVFAKIKVDGTFKTVRVI